MDDMLADRPVRAPGPRRVVILAAVAAVVLVLDVISKQIAVARLTGRAPVDLIRGVLDLELTRNPGAAFSVATGATVVFTIVAVGVILVIVRTARRLRSRAWALVFGLLLGGAVGNLGDRLFRAPGPLRGEVVDWIHLHHWPVFNLADSAISVGAVVAIVLTLRGVGLDGSRAGAGRERDRDRGAGRDPEREPAAAEPPAAG